jgi:hypothetical protein
VGGAGASELLHPNVETVEKSAKTAALDMTLLFNIRPHSPGAHGLFYVHLAAQGG